MFAINYFEKLNQGVLNHIFHHVGAFSDLSKVCQLFNQVVKAETALLYEGLVGTFGKSCLVYVLKKLGVEDKSDAAKIDRLFCAAHEDQAGGCQNTLSALKLYMSPFLAAEGLVKLWESLSRSGYAKLKSLMTNIKMGADFLQNAEGIQSFFTKYSSELCKVDSLNLNRKNLRVLPPEIFCLSGLTALDLSNNALTVLPKEIGLLSELKDLRLTDNALNELPNEVGNLRSLKNFQCAFNHLRSVPDSICQWKKLRALNLSGNRLQELPDKMQGLKALNYLYVESNRLSSLPSSIGSIPYLVGLYLFGNQISQLPDSLCNMGHLKFLSVQNNALEALPENVGEMGSLTTLLLDANQMKTLPPSVCALKNLEQFSVCDNRLTELPKALGDLQKLGLFSFSGNPVKAFPGSGEKTTLNPLMTQEQFDSIYWGLGDDKWHEYIDGCHHVHGREVYDKGLHGRAVEFGFSPSMMKACLFLTTCFNQRLDADFYLRVHRETCGHFKEKETSTLMGVEKVGVFRDREDVLCADFPPPFYSMTESAINEFNALNMKIGLIFGFSFRIGDISTNPNTLKHKTIYYAPLSRDQVKAVFNFFVTEFYHDIDHAEDDYTKVWAIAKLIQRLEWLHPVRDGCGRTDTALLNYLLTIYGFNPVLLDYPYVSSCKGLDEWTLSVCEGMQRWKAAADLKKPTDQSQK